MQSLSLLFLATLLLASLLNSATSQANEKNKDQDIEINHPRNLKKLEPDTPYEAEEETYNLDTDEIINEAEVSEEAGKVQVEESSKVSADETVDVAEEETYEVAEEKTSEDEVETVDVAEEATEVVEEENLEVKEEEKAEDAEEEISEVVEEETSDVAEEEKAEVAEEETSEVVEEETVEVAEENTSDVAKEATEVVEEEPSEVAVEETAEIAEEEPAEVVEDETSDVAEEETAEEKDEVAEDETSEVVEEDNSDDAGEETAEVVEEETSDVAEEETAEVAENDVAGEETSNVAEEETSEDEVDVAEAVEDEIEAEEDLAKVQVQNEEESYVSEENVADAPDEDIAKVQIQNEETYGKLAGDDEVVALEDLDNQYEGSLSANSDLDLTAGKTSEIEEELYERPDGEQEYSLWSDEDLDRAYETALESDANLDLTAGKSAEIKEEAYETPDGEEDYSLSGEDTSNDADNSTMSEDCIDAWTNINQNADENGCVKGKVIKKFVRKCRVPGLKEKILELKSKCSKDGQKLFMAVSTDTGSLVYETVEANSTLLARRKRFVLSGDDQIWTGAKVPVFDATSQSNIRAMKVFERFTCIRFYPWSKHGDVTTNDELGLNHQGYLKFVYEGGCWAVQGNKKNAHGQKVSCCGGITCVHEIGHALGAYHEHQNPLGKGTIRLNPQNSEADKATNFKETTNPNTYSSGFDLTSIMAYGRTTFSNGKGEVITYEFSDVSGGNSWYYLMYEVSQSHHCAELYCSDFTMKCVNDGYLTQVDGVCGCMCPPWLDPTTGCSTVLKDTEGPDTPETSKWPSGEYALPEVKDGCPSSVFSEATRVQTGGAKGDCKDKHVRGCKYWFKVYGCDANPGFMHNMCPDKCGLCDSFGNHQSSNYHLAGSAAVEKIDHKLCVKDATDDDDDRVQWPAGQYCIYKKGGACPQGFDSGWAQFTDEAHDGATNSQDGPLPDGDFSDTVTKFEFCCTKYGFTIDELVLPRTKPFSLLMSGDKDSCHRVRGMHAYQGYTAVKNAGGSPPTFSGHHPVRTLSSDKNTYKIPYCYYVPTEKANCGGEIFLTDDAPSATISASSGPDQMCNWLVKGPEGTRILLKFDEMNIAKDADGNCIDTLTMRYNRPGQQGITYCGDRLAKTISTVNNTLGVGFETFTEGASSFKATVSLISQNNMCYSLADKGHTYRGKVDRTRGMKTCIPWAKAAHCPHSPFVDSDMMDGLTDNSCRNPDTADGLRPWCYTQADGCQRDYCDVCLFESVFDTEPYEKCQEEAKNGLCDDPVKAQQQCAETCKDKIKKFEEPTLAKDVSCPAPGEVADGVIVGSTKDSYKVGDVVTYKCADSSISSSKQRKCLTTGEWSSLNIVCTECELGWTSRNGNCYRLFYEFVTYPTAVSACSAVGASLAMPKTQDEIDFLAGMSFWYGSWLGASDKETEGEWKWNDGTPFSGIKWAGGQPDNYYNEDCVWMQRDGLLEDRWCHSDVQAYVCVKPENEVTSCVDVTDDCSNFVANEPDACSSQADFMKRNCKATCGLCESAGSYLLQ